MFARLQCLLNRHAPERNAVEWDGRDFVSHCRHCEIPVRRIRKRRWARARAEVQRRSSDSAT